MIRFRNRTVVIERWRLSMDPLLPVVLILMAWALSERYYPEVMFLETKLEYWLLGGFTALFITISIIVHEIGHSLMARKLNIPIERIHLYLFGGMAELQHRPHSARQEFWIAIAGPIASLLLAGLSWVMYTHVLTPAHLPFYFFRFLAIINLMIGAFNLLPIFPLDGGRLMRAFIWAVNGNYIRASAITKNIGSIFVGLLLVVAVMDYLYFESAYVMIGGILALYMMYTYYSGRYELNYAPNPEELIHVIPHVSDTRKMVQSIAEKRKKVVRRCIFPILENDNDELQVIHGKHIATEEFHIDPATIRTAGKGDFIDLDEPETWHKSVSFNAEWVPVFKENTFVGMCDARELRFWMEQNDGVLGAWPELSGKL
ncbi:MAG: site-2 protease family protein [Balneolia bacterium]|nr:site-2 protease family protein [Balneolia bacterium]